MLADDGTDEVNNVQIVDLEDAVVLPPGSPGLGNLLTGNQFWRSPEAWARAAIYLWLDTMIFFSEAANDAEDASDMMLKLHVSHFVNDIEDFGGFVEYHGGEESPFVERFV
ncbi:hypothetical protein C8A05DRAFT_44519 [Staphylotrichum tortipilum]|uniref:Uncharacterized protein n=1 Tax=Staphylotrichum tortipilum TaxID=2831512 RepID=A0AAN6MJC7_9PEZI|nr:hypothetical protein C8A05DRAFT_44519 [Staphylotrichum longicolle]